MGVPCGLRSNRHPRVHRTFGGVGRRRVCLVFALVAVCGVLSGCGGQSEEVSSADDATFVAAHERLCAAAASAKGGAYDAAIGAFNVVHDAVHLMVTRYQEIDRRGSAELNQKMVDLEGQIAAGKASSPALVQRLESLITSFRKGAVALRGPELGTCPAS